MVEVCAIVYRPDGNIPCPIDVSLSTNDNSAGEVMYLNTAQTFHATVLCIYFQYSLSHGLYCCLTGHLDVWGMCERRHYVNVTIENDDVLEDTESFDVTLERTTGLDSRITLDPVDGKIEITDNDGKFVSTCHYSLSSDS